MADVSDGVVLTEFWWSMVASSKHAELIYPGVSVLVTLFRFHGVGADPTKRASRRRKQSR
jgi:hypothetical protein